MSFDRSDVGSLTAIAFGGVVGLLGTGALVLDAAPDDQRIDVRVEQVTQSRVRRGEVFTAEIRTLRDQGIDLPNVTLGDRPAIYLDGVRIEGDRMSLEDLDPRDIESIEVTKDGGLGGRAAEVRIRLQSRR